MPIDPQSLLIFIPIALALNLTPGADMLFCLGQGIQSGPRAGFASSLGIATGSFIHSLLAGLGLAALVASHSVAFEVIRWAGVAYLLWLALSSVLSSAAEPMQVTSSDSPAVSRNTALAAWRKGILVCLLNPKVALFILALVPQFVDPARGSVLLQFLVYGAVLNTGGTLVNGLVGVFAGRLGGLLVQNPIAARVLQYCSAIVFAGLAVRLAVDWR